MSGSEILFLLVAGLVVLGPERLPGVIRKGGKIYGDLRRAASGYEKEFTSGMAGRMQSYAHLFGDLHKFKKYTNIISGFNSYSMF